MSYLTRFLHNVLSFDAHLSWVSKTPIGETLDHTLLKPEATQSQFDALFEEARTNGIGYVCVPGSRLESAVRALSGSVVQVASVMGFPHGNGHPRARAHEAAILLGCGASELDMVLDVGAMKEKNYHDVQRDIRLVVDEALKKHTSPARLVKVILETCLLTEEEIIDASMLCVLAGAHFVKTSTGFSTGGATKHAVRLMKLTVGDAALVKASGGIRTHADAVTMLQNGASRIGTSAGVAIVKAAASSTSS